MSGISPLDQLKYMGQVDRVHSVFYGGEWVVLLQPPQVGNNGLTLLLLVDNADGESVSAYVTTDAITGVLLRPEATL